MIEVNIVLLSPVFIQYHTLNSLTTLRKLLREQTLIQEAVRRLKIKTSSSKELEVDHYKSFEGNSECISHYTSYDSESDLDCWFSIPHTLCKLYYNVHIRYRYTLLININTNIYDYIGEPSHSRSQCFLFHHISKSSQVHTSSRVLLPTKWTQAIKGQCLLLSCLFTT
jgi:hypothetical protein